VRLMRDA